MNRIDSLGVNIALVRHAGKIEEDDEEICMSNKGMGG